MKIRGAMYIKVSGENLALLPERAIFWESAETLVVADLHLGRGSAARASGLPVPAGSTNGTLNRLSHALQKTGAIRLVVIGDLWHHPAGNSSAAAIFQKWRRQWPSLEIAFIPGNHDRPLEGLAAKNLTVCDEIIYDPPFIWRHEPFDDTFDKFDGYLLCGHLHPGVRLRGPAREHIRLPCFYFSKKMGIMPAFGEFTGLSMIRPKWGDQVFLVLADQVVAAREQRNIT